MKVNKSTWECVYDSYQFFKNKVTVEDIKAFCEKTGYHLEIFNSHHMTLKPPSEADRVWTKLMEACDAVNNRANKKLEEDGVIFDSDIEDMIIEALGNVNRYGG